MSEAATTNHRRTDPASVLAGLAGLQVAKGHGTGNDFVLIADPEDACDVSPEQVAVLCDRKFGIGADGLIRAVPSHALPEGRDLLAEHPDAAWFMDYRNGDGSVSEMCGNGVRVFVHFLAEQGLVDLGPGQSLTIGTRAGIKVVTRSANGYAVDMGPWEFIFPEAAAERALDSLVETDGLDVDRPALSISMGNPHTVVAVADADELAAANLHRAPRVDPLPPYGTNVEFVLPADPLVQDGQGRIRMRVHERGVGETLSCGTGACAAAVATRHWSGEPGNTDWEVTVPGGVVRVRFLPAPDGTEHVELSGPAVLVAHATVV